MKLSSFQLSSRLRCKQLSLVVALDDHRNLHLAAEAIHLTQPSATKLLQDLEGAFGVCLFERHPRGMQPSELGAEVVKFARRFLIDLDRLSDDLENKKHGGYGHLVIGAIMGAAPDVVTKAIADIKQRRPLLVIKLLGETSDEVIKLLAQRKIDVAVGRFSQIEQHNDIQYEVLGNEILHIVARKGHRLAMSDGLTLKALVECPWVLQPITSPARQIIEQEFGEVGVRSPRNVVECSSVFATLQLVQTSDAITLLPESVIRDHLHAGLLVHLPITVGKRLPGFGILTRRDDALSANSLEFIDCLRRYGATVPQRPPPPLAMPSQRP